MSTKVIIIHSSEIIGQGISAIIRRHLKTDSIVLNSSAQLTNYQNISKQHVLFIVEAELYTDQFLSTTEIFRKLNHVKIIRVHTVKKDGKCADDCDCCFAVNDDPEKIVELLSPCMDQKKPESNKKRSSSLTEREIEVVKLVALGKTNKDIAESLCISIHTVISHRKNITEKLGIKSISGLTVFAVLNHYIDTTSVDL
jgi:DNA-binding CsgD family transcriptional regulator